MKVKNSTFVKSCSDPKDASGEKFSPQICVAGRSNCGKSSLLNLLMNAKLCKTSQTPGRTRLINIFETAISSDDPVLPDRFYFVDLPGYGFSRAAKAESDEWNARTSAYFESNGAIAQTLCLMDIRRDPSDLDKTLINYLRDLGLPFTVVLTKSDKLSRSACGNAKIKIAAALGLARDDLIVTSALDRSGRDAVLARIEAVLNAFYS